MSEKYKTLKDLTEMKITWYESIYYWCWRQVNWVWDIPREIKYFWQRGVRGFSERDVWCLSDHLAEIIAKGTKELSKEVQTKMPGNNSCYGLLEMS